jgi:parallel beta-helix repeat protein
VNGCSQVHEKRFGEAPNDQRNRASRLPTLTVIVLAVITLVSCDVVTRTDTIVRAPTPPSPVEWKPTAEPAAARRVPPARAIRLGDSWQAKVDASPAGTTFVIRAGVHSLQQVTPKDGDVFVGDPGAVMDGGMSATFAFGGGAKNVQIRGLEIRKYNSPLQRGAIGPEFPTAMDGWLIENVDVHDNFGAGVTLGSRSTLRNSRVHDNGQIGIKANGPVTDVLFDNVEVDHNNTNNNDAGWEAGGSKFSDTTNLTVRNCYVHDNNGPGLWTDINNYNTLYENNRVENNLGPGIFHEISYDGIIRNNTITGNGLNWHPWLWGAGIQIAASSNVEVYGNTVTGNGNGISLIQQNRGSGTRGAWIVQNVNVHDNTISGSGYTGAVQDMNDNSIFTSRNNRFQHNTYHSPTGWAWNNDNQIGSFSTWQSYGQDTTGTAS